MMRALVLCVICLGIAITAGCREKSPGLAQQQTNGVALDPFYSSKGTWDYARMPLIFPYELSDLSGVMDVVDAGRQDGRRPIVVAHVISVHVENGGILGSTEAYLHARRVDVPAKWFMLDPSTRELWATESREEFLLRCQERGMSVSNDLTDARDLLQLYQRGRKTPWLP
jgi:hypothetical protein